MARGTAKRRLRAISAGKPDGSVPSDRKAATVLLRVENADGDMTVSPTKLTLPRGRGHTVTWKPDPASPVKIKSFECLFYEGTPLDWLSFNDRQPTGHSSGAPPAVYHYTVVVTTATRIVQISGCPEVIIR